ncbi:MAG: DUF6311 domain-containing protein [Verrucomicrobiota bacterium]|nr:DUF6311 domain-containing protein [Verrucomicrobiota bacterium]
MNNRVVKIPEPSGRFRYVPVLIGAMLGLFFAVYYLGWNKLSGHFDTQNVADDRFAQIIGASYYVRDGWHLPLGSTPNLHQPEGTNVVFTDSIPVAAIIHKLLTSGTTHFFNYFDLWIGLNFVVQGVLLAIIFQRLGISSLVALSASVAIGLNLPCLINRFGHASLCTHFLIVASIALYVNRKYTTRVTRDALLYGIILVIALYVHIYLLAMLLPLFAAWIVQNTMEGKYTTTRAIVTVATTSSVLMVLLYALIGINTNTMPSTGGGYGQYGMDIASPVLPWISGVFNTDGSKVMYGLATQYEGFNYLGLGVILLTLNAFIFGYGSVKIIIRQNIWYALAAIILTAFAVTHRWFFASIKIGTIPYIAPGYFFEQFRGSGRFFWPVAYIIMISGLVIYTKVWRAKWAVLVLVFLALIQIYDASWVSKHSAFPSTLNFPAVLNERAEWRAVVSSYNAVNIYPYFWCGGNNYHMLQELFYICSLENKPINNGYIARNQRSCDSQYDELLPLEDRTLYVFIKAVYTLDEVMTLTKGTGVISERAGAYIVFR